MKAIDLFVSEAIINHKRIQNQHLQIDNGIIQSISTIEEPSSTTMHHGVLVPGFIDIQVNGGGGVLFNKTPTSEALVKIAKAHQQFGTTSWLPTVITDSLENMHLAANAVASARKLEQTGIVGIHFEGPHLSKEKNGIHKEQFIRKISSEELEIYCRKDLGVVMLTVAPETVNPDVIRELVANGAIVSLGHSNATIDQTRQALDAGATCFTHLFNAMSQLTSREPGMIGAALTSSANNPEPFAGIILDGIHVHKDSARLAFKSKEKMILVTDAMPPVGSEDPSFDYFGQMIVRDNNVLRDEQGRLAGSVVDMATAVKNCQNMIGMDLIQALDCATLHPAQCLNIDSTYGAISVGKKANLVLLDDQGGVVKTWINGNQVYSNIN